ncbi:MULTISPECIES: aminoglycoside phosphotransferase family protein [unclassified Planococcus (in: firmicutes)]|uniref:aminoglycoside phosphotransferase family protein n=1 Tax=unclassified Planococcus (in: firmicutes) TaxID=2662419 RepID=UPI000C7D57F5|nr:MULTISPECIES: aminoglycoside phosphotransferase family protein [unclassified Planococcus (in: firmicutes)]PKG45636.1 phosphotransferase [Planococcus sp. Urea-trap-24]PKG88655.1 phosphotransferase [Planococcus sp. Urea-3u-39]PKH38627.1 phosphotransferase [Planococcus sp. MB-3u-09]
MLDQVLKQFRLEVVTFNEVEDSFSSTVYKCTLSNGESVFVKIPYTRVKYERELAAYEILAGHVPIPKLLGFWEGDAKCPGALLLSELKGKPLSATASPEIAYQIGTMQASMHQIKPSNKTALGAIQNEFPNWHEFIERQFYSFAEDAKEVLDEDLYMASLRKFEQMKLELPAPDGPSFVHMDFRPANIIVEEGQVSGMIDFESVRFGSTEIDFTKIYRDFLKSDPALLNSYQMGYNSIRPMIDLRAVLPFYRFIDAFNSIGWSQRRGLEKNFAFYETNLGILKKMVE